MAIPPRISIITVSYNSVATIEETILSVVEQDYPTIEYIIIDGGSTDGTLDIIKKYESHLSYWQSSPDQNMYDAINKGLGKVSGQLWMSLNSDDYLASSQVVSIVATYYKRYGSTYGAYYGNIIKKKGNIFRPVRLFTANYSVLLASEHCSFMPQPSTFLLKEVSDKVGMFDINYRYASDYDYFLRVAYNYKIKHIPTNFTIFRDHEGSITNRLATKMNEERLQIIQKYRKEKPVLFSFLFKYCSWAYYLLINRRFPIARLLKLKKSH
jgi:glycosyltransferase involved in cell wall biosynthesis